MKQVLTLGIAAAALTAQASLMTSVAHADGCTQSSWGGQCDFNFAPDGSHEHCDSGNNIPFVGYVQNCFWVNTHP